MLAKLSLFAFLLTITLHAQGDAAGPDVAERFHFVADAKQPAGLGRDEAGHPIAISGKVGANPAFKVVHQNEIYVDAGKAKTWDEAAAKCNALSADGSIKLIQPTDTMALLFVVGDLFKNKLKIGKGKDLKHAYLYWARGYSDEQDKKELKGTDKFISLADGSGDRLVSGNLSEIARFIKISELTVYCMASSEQAAAAETQNNE